VRHSILIDLAKLFRERVEVCALQVLFGDRVAEFGHFQHCFESLELSEELLVHFLLPLDHVVTHFNLFRRERLELIILVLQDVAFLLHILIQLVFLFSDQPLVQVNHSVELLDFLALFFDSIRVFLGQFEVESGDIVDSLALFIPQLDVSLQRGDLGE